jgi:hypothetical protein
MEAPALAQLVSDMARGVAPSVMPPALLPLPRIRVSAELWHEERHVRIVGDALYAVHCGDSARWAVVVSESNTLDAGSVHLIELAEIRCESPSGRRGIGLAS